MHNFNLAAVFGVLNKQTNTVLNPALNTFCSSKLTLDKLKNRDSSESCENLDYVLKNATHLIPHTYSLTPIPYSHIFLSINQPPFNISKTLTSVSNKTLPLQLENFRELGYLISSE